MSTKCDAIVIGTGQAGPSLAVWLAGHGNESGDHRAQAFRRHLCQHWLYPDEDAGRERACSASIEP